MARLKLYLWLICKASSDSQTTNYNRAHRNRISCSTALQGLSNMALSNTHDKPRRYLHIMTHTITVTQAARCHHGGTQRPGHVRCCRGTEECRLDIVNLHRADLLCRLCLVPRKGAPHCVRGSSEVGLVPRLLPNAHVTNVFEHFVTIPWTV
jgi:hypothetical protein